jgi:hypothetical protein
MTNKQPFTWKPTDVIVVTNVSNENILLDLDSGPLRLDRGRTLRLTASALELPQLMALINTGNIKLEEYRAPRFGLFGLW